MNALALVQRYVIGALHGLAPSEPLDCGGLLVRDLGGGDARGGRGVAWRCACCARGVRGVACAFRLDVSGRCQGLYG